MMNDMQIVILQANRDEDTLFESGLWPDFEENKDVVSNMHGYLFRPGKILIGICSNVVGKGVSFVALMKNSWTHY